MSNTTTGTKVAETQNCLNTEKVFKSICFTKTFRGETLTMVLTRVYSTVTLKTVNCNKLILLTVASILGNLFSEYA